MVLVSRGKGDEEMGCKNRRRVDNGWIRGQNRAQPYKWLMLALSKSVAVPRTAILSMRAKEYALGPRQRFVHFRLQFRLVWVTSSFAAQRLISAHAVRRRRRRVIFPLLSPETRPSSLLGTQYVSQQ